MISFFVILSIQLLLIIIGLLFSLLIGVKDKIENLGLSYLFGSGLVTIVFLLNNLFFNLKLGAINFIISVGISFSIIFIFLLIKKRFIVNLEFVTIKKISFNLSCLEKFILFFILLIIAYTFFENYIWPITDWDSLAFYDFRAKVISMTGSMKEGVELGYFFQYPPYTSFLHVFGYLFGSERVKIVYSFIFSSLLLVFYSLVRRRQSRLISLFSVLTIAVDRFIFTHSVMAYSNLSYLVFISLGLIYLYYWVLDNDNKDLSVGSLLVATSTWVRSTEPFWMIGILLIVLGSIKNKKDLKHPLFFISLILIVDKLWSYYVGTFTINNPSIAPKRIQMIIKMLNQNNFFSYVLSKIAQVSIYLFTNLKIVFGYLLIPYLLSLYYDIRRKYFRNLFASLLILIILLFIYLGTLIFSLTYDTWNLISDSLQRLSMVLTPIFIFAIFNSSIWEKDNEKK